MAVLQRRPMAARRRRQRHIAATQACASGNKQRPIRASNITQAWPRRALTSEIAAGYRRRAK